MQVARVREKFYSSNSLKLALHIGHGRNQVDGATGNNHSGLAGKDASSGIVDLLGGHALNCVEVLPDGKGAVGGVVAGNFLKTVSTALHGEKEVHLQGVLGASELNLADGLSEGVKGRHSNLEEILRVGTSTVNLNAEEAGVSEVAVDGVDAVKETVGLNSVVGTAGVARRESVSTADKLVHDLEDGNLTGLPSSRLERDLDGGLGRLSPGSVLATDVG